MSFFNRLLERRGLERHDGRPIWKYNLSSSEFEELKSELQLEDNLYINPIDAFVYYAEWWRNCYDGGAPSKIKIFQSIDGRLKRFGFYDQEDFYKEAKKGARSLGIKWVVKQNTLFFKSMLINGGLPLKHIQENSTVYQDFLFAVLDAQPESIEDFMHDPQIIKYLPASSRNEVIFENCLAIVKSILNNENDYDELLNSNQTIRNISKALKARSETLERKRRTVKPKNFWILNEQGNIELKIGLKDQYKPEQLKDILGFDVTEREYKFFINEQLICVFRMRVDGNFKTDWYSKGKIQWKKELELPEAYVLINERQEIVNDFIQINPNLDAPSLWVQYEETQWRLIKGNATSEKQGLVIFNNLDQFPQNSEPITIDNQQLNAVQFEGEIKINLDGQPYRFLTGVSSFDWTIISHKPHWMLKSSMAVVRNKPEVLVYDESGERLSSSVFNVALKKRGSGLDWKSINEAGHLSAGCYDIRITREGITVYDVFYHLGSLKLEYLKESLENGQLEVKDTSLEFRLLPDETFDHVLNNHVFKLKWKQESKSIKNSLEAYLKEPGTIRLSMRIKSPLRGIALINEDGSRIPTNATLIADDFQGLRILTSPQKETILTIQNSEKRDIKINKVIRQLSQPLIAYKEVVQTLLDLGDIMKHSNTVMLTISDGINRQEFKVRGFKYFLNVENQLNLKVQADTEIDLFAIPLNCPSKHIQLIPLSKDKEDYLLPQEFYSQQFILISDQSKALLPRFVNTFEDYLATKNTERIDAYHKEYIEASFQDESLKILREYESICWKNKLPYSTFDQFRAVGRSGLAAAKVFFYLGYHQEDTAVFIEEKIPQMEQELGFCFHWISKLDWESAFFWVMQEVNIKHEEFLKSLMQLQHSYFGHNDLMDISLFIQGETIGPFENIGNQDLQLLRQSLGQRVLNELPTQSPYIETDKTRLIQEHQPVRLLIQSPIAIAESIKGVDTKKSIWGGDKFTEEIRRNIQYSQYIAPDFYKNLLCNNL